MSKRKDETEEEWKIRRKAQSRAYYQANPELHRAVQKAWRDDNKDRLEAQRKANKDKLNANARVNARKRYAANPEKYRAYNKAWRAANPKKYNAVQRKRRAAASPEVKVRIAALHKEWTAANLDHLKAYRREYGSQYYAKNKERINKRMNEDYAQNSEKYKLRQKEYRNRLKHENVVYFAYDRGLVKIGTTTSVQYRLKSLKTASPFVEIIGTIPGDRATEAQLHKAFAEDRVSREWFRATPKLLALASGGDVALLAC